MKKYLFSIAAIGFVQASLAAQSNHMYVGVDAGVYQANFNNRYTDLTDIIPQHISQPVLQNNFTGGLSLGYVKELVSQFFIGAELNGNLEGNSALFQSGAQSSAFTDSLKVKNHVDLDLVPGVWLTSSIASYLKLGISWAHISDTLYSPVGFNPIYQTYSADKTIGGFAASIGIKKIVNDRMSLFTEYNYHDYGSVDLPNFQNFTANYSHNVHVYTSSINVGAMYRFNC